MSSDPVHRVFTFALRAGSIMARNGAPAANVTHTLLAIARSFGHPQASANVTMDQLTLSEISVDQDRTVTLSQSVGASDFNLTAISATESVARDVIRGEITLGQGLRRLEAIERSDLGHAGVVRLLGWAMMSAGFAVLLGARPFSILLAALTALLIEAVGAGLSKGEVPVFFSHVLAGMLATGAAVLAVEVTPGQAPALIITAALVSRLAGGAALGAAQDLLTGWYITGAGRVIEAVLLSTGQVVGVVSALTIAARLGTTLSIEADPQPTTDLAFVLLAGVMIAGGFAIASQAPWSRLPAICALALTASLLNALLLSAGMTSVSALGIAATTIGATAVLAGRAIRIPSAGALGVALAPLLPGMEIYLGFVAMTTDEPALPRFLTAAVLALALGAGAVLGQYLAAQALWHGMRARRAGEERLRGEATVDARALTAEWLSTPVFRRPFLVEEYQPTTTGEMDLRSDRTVG